ncbi:MAG: LacI family DNA-binding transcriptional regulator [Acidobacteriaceae bacterium]
MVGVIAPDLGGGYDSEILTGIERFLMERQYLYFVSSHRWDTALIRQRLEVFAERGAEGIILINTPAETGSRLPMVLVGAATSDLPHTHITLDNARGIRLAVEHLYESGHRQIAFFKGHTTSSDTEPRWAAIKQVVKSLDLNVGKDHVVQLKRIDHGLNPIREGYLAAQRLLRTERPFTALLAFNDLSAIGAIHALRDAGKRVPEDVSVIGFDDVQAASIIQPALTTIRQPLARMGMLAATEILTRIEDAQSQPHNIVIQPELIIRQSSGPAPRAGNYVDNRVIHKSTAAVHV